MKFFDMEVTQRAVCDGCSKRASCGAWCQMPRYGTITVDREENEHADIDLHYSSLGRTISLCDDCRPRVENFPAIWCRAVDWEIAAARPLPWRARRWLRRLLLKLRSGPVRDFADPF